ncbi:MAG TPA: TonB-dependent receptor [Ramlibacter sp.]|nr:TonB-dependent receptor [Ramlibacter sp.]
MSMNENKAGVLAALLVASAAVQAQAPGDAGGDAPAGTLETVTVNARRSIEQRFFAPGSLVVVDRGDIENLGAFSVADVLRQLPGVVVTTSADGSVDIRMRGMDRNSTQLLIDGQRTSSGRSQLPLDQLPPELVERIEVVRAPTAEFSGATGGTINIVLRQASVRRETVVRFTDNIVWGRQAVAAFFSRTGPLFGGNAPATAGDDVTAQQPWAYFVSVARLNTLLGSDSHRTVTDPFGSTSTDAASRYRRGEYSLVPRLNGRLGPADTLALRGTFNRSRFRGDYEAFADPVPGTPTTYLELQGREREYLQGAADWTHRLRGSKVETTLSGSTVREDVVRDGLTSDTATGLALATTSVWDVRRENLWTLRSKVTGTGDALLWMFGGEVDRRDLSVDNATNGAAANYGAVVDRRVLWGQNEWEVLDGATLTAGLRGESITTETQTSGLTTARIRNSFLQPSLHLRKPIDENLQWRANLARTTRNPRVWDLVDRPLPSQGRNSITNPDNIGNPGLRPERSLAVDTGFEKRIAGGGVLGFNVFLRDVQDAFATLVTNAGGRWVEQRVNIGDARVLGLEFDVKGSGQWLGLGRAWNLSSHATLLHSRMTSGVNRGERIPGQPRYTANLNLNRPIPRGGGLFGGGTLTLTGPADLNTAPGLTGRDASRVTLDLHVGQLIRGFGYWRVGVQNVGDAPYRRERRSVDPTTGGATLSSSELTLRPRVYVTYGATL